jgi:hypothetical protein
MAITMTDAGRTNSYMGLSTDTKPVVNVPNASTFYEMDTADLYFYDAEHSVWLKH